MYASAHAPARVWLVTYPALILPRACPTSADPTRVRGLGANTAFLFNVMGCIPASNWVYSDLDEWVIGLGIAAANLIVAGIAAFLPETAGVGFDE